MSLRRRLVILAVLVSLLCAAPVAALASEGRCTRLSGPPSYSLPVVAEFESLTTRTFHAQLEEGGPEVPLVAMRGRDGSWTIARLDVVRSDEVAPATLVKQPAYGSSYRYEVPTFVRSGDVDADGHLDLVVLWEASHSEDAVAVYLSTGDGGFEVGQPTFSAFGIYDIELGDFDGDGADDLALLNSHEDNRILIYRFTKGEGFALSQVLTELSPRALVASDFDGNGLEDLAFTNRVPFLAALTVRFGFPGAPLSSPVRTHGQVNFPAEIFARRLDPSGPAEIVVLDRLQPYDQRFLVVRVFEAVGFSFRLESAQRFPDDLLWVFSNVVTTFDADEDGIRDLLFENAPPFSSRGSGIALFRGHDDATYSLVHRSHEDPTLVDVARVDGDALQDLLVLGDGTTLSRFPAGPDGDFLIPDTFQPIAHERTYSSVAGDVDDDGFEDLVVGVLPFSSSDWEVEWWRSRGDGSFESMALDGVPGSPRPLQARDLDGDGFTDLVVRTYVPELESTWLMVEWGEGSAPDGDWRPVLKGDALRHFVFDDFDGDGDVDLATAATRNGAWRNGYDISLYLLEGRTYRLSQTDYLAPFDYGGDTPSLTSGDTDGDGLPELIHFVDADASYRIVTLVRREITPEGTLGPVEPLPMRSIKADIVPRLFDVDLDGDDDVILVRCFAGDKPLVVLETDGDAPMRTLFSGPVVDGGCPSLDFADVNADGVIDAFESSRAASFRVWLGDGTGGFRAFDRGYFLMAPQGAVSYATNLTRLIAATGGPGLDFARPEGYRTRSDGGLRFDLQKTRLLDEDTEPPMLEPHAWPEIDSLGQVDRFAQQWRLTGLATDTCTSVRVTDLFVGAPALAGVPVQWRSGSAYEVRLFEDRDGAPQDVVLVGPNETVARAFYERMLADGGFSLKPNTFLRLSVRDALGSSAQELGESAGGYLTHQWFFDRDGLTGIVVQRPEGDVAFSVAAEDATGKRSEAWGRFVEERRDFCESESAQDVVCGE